MEVFEKVKNGTTIKSSYSTYGYLSKEYKNTNSKDLCTWMLTAALFRITNIWKQPKCPMSDEWLKKMYNVHVQWKGIQPKGDRILLS